MNVLKVLDHFNIDYRTEGSKLSNCSATVDCPECGDGDPDNYGRGIFDNGINTCWKCKKTLSFYGLIRKVTGTTFDEFISVSGGVKTVSGASIKENLTSILKPKVEKEEKVPFVMPMKGLRSVGLLSNTLIDRFIKERNFKLETLQHFGSLWARSGELFGHLVIPVMDINHVKDIAYVARDLTGTDSSKYRFPKGVKIHEEIYCTHSADQIKHWKGKKNIFIVEGVLDAWAVYGEGGIAIAIFGTHLHTSQLLKCWKIAPRDFTFCIMLDSDTSINQAHKIADKLRNSTFSSSEIIYLKKGDPASIPRKILQGYINHPYIKLER